MFELSDEVPSLEAEWEEIAAEKQEISQRRLELLDLIDELSQKTLELHLEQQAFEEEKKKLPDYEVYKTMFELLMKANLKLNERICTLPYTVCFLCKLKM